MNDTFGFWGLVLFSPLVLFIVLFLGYFAYQRRKLGKIYGFPSIPEDIQEIQRNFGSQPLEVQLDDFSLVSSEGKHSLFERKYPDKGGFWSLKIETREGKIIAYNASFTSKHSFFMSSPNDFSGTVGIAKFLSS